MTQGCAVYVHNFFDIFGKLGVRERSVFSYNTLEYFRRYVFIHEYEHGGVIKLESRDMTFLENEFPTKCEREESFIL